MPIFYSLKILNKWVLHSSSLSFLNLSESILFTELTMISTSILGRNFSKISKCSINELWKELLIVLYTASKCLVFISLPHCYFCQKKIFFCLVAASSEIVFILQDQCKYFLFQDKLSAFRDAVFCFCFISSA